MPEPLKNCFSEGFVRQVAQYCQENDPKFERQRFVDNVLIDDWQTLELKQRMNRIAEVLGYYLPNEYPEALDILLPVASKFTGLAHMCFPEFVEQHGLEYFEISMQALETLTEGSTSEFAIRPFILRSPEKTMKQMAKWSKSNNKHVRRLASEGCRPRLPWAMALPKFKQEPQPVLNIILPLINDDSLYVRRSVANNLNDISKDHPEKIVEIASQYLGQSKNVDWVIKHACRGLLKQGHPQVLSLFGYSKAEHIAISDFIVDQSVNLGERLNFEFALNSKRSKLGKLRLEFMIDFMKANGKQSGKVFKISEGDYTDSSKTITKSFSFRPITTRKYYLGKHRISVVINGETAATKEFNLIA